MDNDDTQPLLVAIHKDNPEILKILVDSEIYDINEKAPDGWPFILNAAINGQYKCLKVLLDGGANVNAVNDLGETALMKAVSYNNQTCMELLIKYGADLNIKNMYGESALAKAKRYGHKHLVYTLSQLGAI